MNRERLALLGFIFFIFAVFTYGLGVFVAIPRRLFFAGNVELLQINESIVWYSGIPLLIGISLILFDLFFLFPKKRKNKFVTYNDTKTLSITVALTAYNDEESIAKAIADFKSHPLVKRVIVVSNNSKDRTILFAQNSGALVFNEEAQGYGSCVYRALAEAVKFDDTNFTILCEGDMTFRAYDIDKFVAYIPHADIVNGTRISESLRDKDTQLSTFSFYGNFFVAKLLELKHLGNSTFTDVGTTYKICRNEKLKKIIPALNPHINLEFNPYFLDIALKNDLIVIECPITFHKRIGLSKGASSNFKALKIGIRMIKGILFDWK